MNDKKSLVDAMFGELYAIRRKAERIRYPEIATLCDGIADEIRRCERPSEAKPVADCARDAVEKQMKLYDLIQTGIINVTTAHDNPTPVIDALAEFSVRFDRLQQSFYPYLQRIEPLMAPLPADDDIHRQP